MMATPASAVTQCVVLLMAVAGVIPRTRSARVDLVGRGARGGDEPRGCGARLRSPPRPNLPRNVGHVIAFGARRLLVVTLFLLGLGLSRTALRSLGFRPVVQAIGLRIVLATIPLTAIIYGWIA